MDLIPYLLGAKLQCQEAGGWMSQPLSADALRDLEPVDMEKHPFAEWLLRERDRKKARYGCVEQFLDYEGPTNIAVRMRGEEFYIDLIADPHFAAHQLAIMNKSIFSIFRFIKKHFTVSGAFGLGNCNVTMISPATYENTIRDSDSEFSRASALISGFQNDLMLHHCDVKIDPFIETYRAIPHLKGLQASHASDIERITRGAFPLSFAAMFNPREMAYNDMDTLSAAIDRAIRLGSSEIDMWNIDPSTPPEQVSGMLGATRQACARAGKDCVISVIPFCWDELEWAFPRYQNQSFNLDLA
jgi:hypothetical protein